MKIAILVNKENDDPLWPVWLDYYSPHVDHIEEIKLRENNPSYPPGAFAKEAGWTQRELLKDYNAVIYTDIDEFLVPDPAKYDGLRNYINQHYTELPCAKGFHLVHNGEDEIDLGRPLLSQRSWWAYDKLYSKRLITNKPVNWTPGFHMIDGQMPPQLGNDLILLHVLYCDAELALKRLRVSYPQRSMTQVLEKIESFELEIIPERFKVI